MVPPGAEEGLRAALPALIEAAHPDLRGQPVRVLAHGWDCLAAEVGGRVILRLPRDAEAEASLAREAALLAVLRPRVRLRLPDLRLVPTPRLHTRHDKIPGEHLLAADFDRLSAAARDALAEDLAGLFADLHAGPVAAMRAAGAGPVAAWLPPGEIARRVAPVLPPEVRAPAEAALDAWAQMGADPLGEVYGHFDAHGWNMAFDHAAGRLNGIYDFGDSGLGPCHGEFVAPALVSPDLVARIIPRYERITGRAVDRRRVALMTGVHRLWELALEAEDPETAPLMLRSVAAWFGAAGPLARDL